MVDHFILLHIEAFFLAASSQQRYLQFSISIRSLQKCCLSDLTCRKEDSGLVRLAESQPASSAFLSHQFSTSQQSASSIFLSQQISTSHQPLASRMRPLSWNPASTCPQQALTKLKIRCESIPSKAQSKQEFSEQIVSWPDLSRNLSGEALPLLKPSFTSSPYPTLPTVH
jgi:hypothetical protein